jgi:hypothetical protein
VEADGLNEVVGGRFIGYVDTVKDSSLILQVYFIGANVAVGRTCDTFVVLLLENTNWT